MRISDWSSDVCSSDLEKLEILLQHLRAASSGDAAVRVTPAPFTAGGPMVTWGGTTPKAAQRAARFGLGFLSQSFDATLAPAYEQACKDAGRSAEHTSELQSLMRISYAVFCL